MTVETASFLNDLNSLYPAGTDFLNEGDNHLRMLKTVLQATFPGLSGRAWRSSVKTSNYSLLPSDNCSIVVITAAGVVVSSSAAATTMGNGFLAIIVTAANPTTFDPNGAETVNGIASIVVPANSCAIVQCDGANWRTLSGFVQDSSALVAGSVDSSKVVRMEADGLSANTTRVLTVQDKDGTVALTSEFAYSTLAGSPGRLELPWGYIYGCEISNAAVDLTNAINFAPGQCRDSNNVGNLILSASLVKRIDSGWAQGNDAGGRVGSLANTTWHCFLIRKVSTGAVDACFSTDPLGSDIPSATFGVNDTRFRRVGSIIRISNANLKFVQFADRFVLDTPTQETNSPVNATAQLVTLSRVPSGIQVIADIASFAASSTGSSAAVLISSPSIADNPAGVNLYNQYAGATSGTYNVATHQILTNQSAQVRVRASTSVSSFEIITHGWIDKRL